MEKETEFIFPMNYKEKEKLLGFIEYKTLIVLGIIGTIVFFILKIVNLSIIVKVTIFVSVLLFFTVLILVGVNGENMIDFLYFAIKFLFREKVYVYRK